MIDHEELVKFIYDNESDQQENMREAFRLCDTDEDCSMMALFDQDGDEKLNYQEFSDMME